MAPVRVFPGGFNLHHPIDKLIRIIGAFDHSLFERALAIDWDQTGEKMNRRNISFGSETYHLAFRGFTIHRPQEQKSLSRESNALYLAQSEDSRDGILFQYLPPHSKTSRHHHTARTEIFHSFEGAALLHVPERTVCLSPTNSYVVGPNVWHQLETGASPALTVLEIISDNSSALFSVDDHIYQ